MTDAALDQRVLDEFQRGFERVMQAVQHFRGSLSARETTILKIGLRSAHVEEAMAQGEIDRAREHFDKMMQLARQLGGT